MERAGLRTKRNRPTIALTAALMVTALAIPVTTSYVSSSEANAAAGKKCSDLAGVKIAGNTIGLPTGGAGGQAYGSHCMVSGDIKPVDPAALNIEFQLALPEKWNGKAAMLGGAGLNGSLPPLTNASTLWGSQKKPLPLSQGYAVFASDSGHQNQEGNTLPLSVQIPGDGRDERTWHGFIHRGSFRTFLQHYRPVSFPEQREENFSSGRAVPSRQPGRVGDTTRACRPRWDPREWTHLSGTTRSPALSTDPRQFSSRSGISWRRSRAGWRRALIRRTTSLQPMAPAFPSGPGRCACSPVGRNTTEPATSTTQILPLCFTVIA